VDGVIGGSAVFVQVIQAKTSDPQGVRRQFERWDQKLKSGASGFLGSTGGVSEDGEFIAIARFNSEEDARANSSRPEQSQWWAETEKSLDGTASFYDCTEVDVGQGGGSDDAGFVQVIQGTVNDKELMRRSEREFEEQMRDVRPDVIGSITGWQGNNFTSFVYFTSEAEAREGERRQEQTQDGGDSEEWMGNMTNTRWIDLKDPWMTSA
jgi:hypothetical protein